MKPTFLRGLTMATPLLLAACGARPDAPKVTAQQTAAAVEIVAPRPPKPETETKASVQCVFKKPDGTEYTSTHPLCKVADAAPEDQMYPFVVSAYGGIGQLRDEMSTSCGVDSTYVTYRCPDCGGVKWQTDLTPEQQVCMTDFVFSRSAQDADRPLGETDYVVKANWGYFEYKKPGGYFLSDTTMLDQDDSGWKCPDIERPMFVPGMTIRDGLQSVLDFKRDCDKSFENRRGEY